VRYEVAVVKGTKNREAALEFVADLLSPEGRSELAKAGFRLP
jgi:ABC-type molybdate transport system substrate-binding protein